MSTPEAISHMGEHNPTRSSTTHFFTRPDRMLVTMAVLLGLVGLATQLVPLSLTSVIRPPWPHWCMHGFNLLLGLLAGWGCTHVNGHRFWWRHWKWIGAGFSALLIYTWAAGLSFEGSRAWISLGGFSVKPIIFSVLVMPIILVGGCHGMNQAEGKKIIGSNMLVLALLVLCIASGLLQHWRSMGLLVGAAVLGLFLANAQWRLLTGAVAAVLATLAIILYAGGIAFHSWAWPLGRLITFTRGGMDFQIERAAYCIARGGWIGHGFGDTMPTLPEWRSDYVYAAVAYQGGSLACGAIILLYGLLIYAGVRIVARAQDRSLALLATILLANLVLAVLAAMGACLGYLPLLGEPLPFIGLAREATIVFGATIGVLIAAYRSGSPASMATPNRRLRVFTGLAWAGLGVVFCGQAGLILASSKPGLPAAPAARVMRGAILDAQGAILATNEMTFDLWVRPYYLQSTSTNRTSPGPVDSLAVSLNMPIQQIDTRFQRILDSDQPKAELLLKRGLSSDAKEQLQRSLANCDPRAVRYEPVWKRTYPQGRTAAHLLGLLVDGRGVNGVEGSRERQLAAGESVRLTLDGRLQAKVDQELERAGAEFSPTWGYALVVQPKSGAVLAWAQWPFINQPDHRADYGPAWESRIQTSGFEPGSLVKPITIALALESQAVSMDTLIDGHNGLWNYTNLVSLRDPYPLTNVTVAEGLLKSSHIVVAQAAMRLGTGSLHRGLQNFGFGQKTGIELPGEIAGLLHRPDRFSRADLTRLPIGYNLMATCLQLARSYGTLALGGVLMPCPRVVQESPESQSEPSPERRVISKATASQITDVLKQVFAQGEPLESSASPAAGFAGYGATTQKAGPRGGYEPGVFTSAYCAFTQDVLILVVLDEPKPYLRPSSKRTIAEGVVKSIIRSLPPQQ